MGAGAVDLAPHLLVVLLWLKVHGPATAYEVYDALALTTTPSAANNRLEDLRDPCQASR